MNVIISPSYDAMSARVAADMLEILKQLSNPLICPATGHTTIGLYKEMGTLYQQKIYDPSNWLFVGLDEWMGMDINDEKSCHYRITEELFEPLEINKSKTCFFNGLAADMQNECVRIEDFISQNGGIDISILGLGVNGHVGMNEPNTPVSLRSHIAELDAITQQVGQKYFKEPQPITKGITLGLATLLESKHIFLLVNGNHKAAIVKRLIEGEITEDVPASLLRNHSGLRIYLDAEAAQQLQTVV